MAWNHSGAVYSLGEHSMEASNGTQVGGWSPWYGDMTYSWDDASAIAPPISGFQHTTSATEHQSVEIYLLEDVEMVPSNTTTTVCNRKPGSFGNSSKHTLGLKIPMEEHSNATPTQPTAMATSSTNAPMDIIGSVCSTADSNAYVFRCDHLACHGKTFGRWYDLKRHHDGAHAPHRTTFWCHVAGCQRSAAIGGKPFPRKDKLRDHVRKVHAG